ncbi:hypothetical protein B5G12_06190 [Faecalibacterium sp. An58]|uniref:DUF4431 domain-containing protein n=1 Tax=Faecalibacterium sp. An58 TaxID=1965648 RepID=UPI000B385E21|nr:DUF4431 domain-containing protein [Faecalibacterium sp. An58]OUN73797.1 hypothetical protein B5G12_06190 [Faecalibacterium sp. An58]
MKQSSKHRLSIPIVVALVFTVVVIALVVLVGVYVCKTESSTAAAGLDSADQTTTTDNLSGNLATVLGKINNAAAGNNEYDLFEDALVKLVSQYGSFDPNQQGSMQSFSDEWFNPRGVLGVEIQDFDLDDICEMAVCISVPDETSEEGGYSIVLNIYEVEENQVKQSATAVLGAYIQMDTGEQSSKNIVLTPNLGVDQIAAVTLVQKDDRYYFFCEDYSVARSFADGMERSCWVMQYQDHSLQYVCSYTQTGGGSIDFMYTGYKFENGVCVSSDLYYSECYDVTAPYDHFGEAITAFFQDYGIAINEEVQNEARASDGNFKNKSVLPDDTENTILFCFTNKQVCFVAQDVLWSNSSYDFNAQLLRGNTLLENFSDPIETSESIESTGPLYEGNTMSVSGTLVKRDYEINSKNKGTVYILQLDQPVVKSLYSDYLGYNGETEVISEMQIGFENQEDEQRYLDQKITVMGSVMFATTGHHLTKVLLMDAYAFA